MFRHRQKELLAQANPDEDGIPAPVIAAEEDENHDAEWQAVGAESTDSAPAAWPWAQRPKIGGRTALLVGVERVALAFESLANRLVGAAAVARGAWSVDARPR